jgi:hypothetical protein
LWGYEYLNGDKNISVVFFNKDIMDRKQLISKIITENLFFICSILLVISFSFSESLLSISAGLLFLQVFISGKWKDKIEIIKRERSLWALMGIFFIYVFGCIFCNDLSTGLYELNKNIFWLIIPFGVALSPKLSEKKYWILLTIFVSSVSIASIIAIFKIFLPDYFTVTGIRDATYVSHVSFSLQIGFSFFILWYSFLKKQPVLGKINVLYIVIWSAYLIVFLGLQKSLTGIFSFYCTLLVSLFYLIKIANDRFRKNLVYSALGFIIIVPFVYIGFVAHNYFTIKDIKPEYELMSESGNRYSFDFQNKQKENGHFVYWYICNEELENSWNSISSIKINENDASGYSIYHTLIRYMTSKGLRKDAKGVSALTDEDIKNVQSGISNYIFAKNNFSIYPRIYQTIWELDTYFKTGNPNDQSLSQRIEYSKAAFYIIKNNFWGIGTGNFRIEFDNAYKCTNSKLNQKFWFNVHNQYLSYIVKFGIVGFFVIIYLIFSSIRWKKQFSNSLLILFICIIGISNLSETTLETHIGLPFFVYFLSLFFWHQQEK